MAAAPRAGFRKDASREQRRRSGSVTAAAIVYLDCAYDAASGTVRSARQLRPVEGVPFMEVDNVSG